MYDIGFLCSKMRIKTNIGIYDMAWKKLDFELKLTEESKSS